jgi:hydroxyacyl-ACP dehydratase HTD2-like protein with hotdog domain
MSGQRLVGDVAAGAQLAPAIRNASRAQLFLYSAATHNPHRIHYDRDYAVTEGHPDIIVHGPLQGAWLGQYVTDWAGPRGRMLTLTWQNRRSALPEHDYVFRGVVEAVEGDVVRLEVWAEDGDGTVLMPGTATVRLPTS